jgi:hypothetical protein
MAWFQHRHINFEEEKAGVVAAYCGGHVIVDARNGSKVYVEPGFHALESEDDEYGGTYYVAYEPGMEYRSDVIPLEESTPREWELAQQLLAGKIQHIPTEQESEDEEDRFALETEGRLTGVRYHL